MGLTFNFSKSCFQANNHFKVTKWTIEVNKFNFFVCDFSFSFPAVVLYSKKHYMNAIHIPFDYDSVQS